MFFKTRGQKYIIHHWHRQVVRGLSCDMSILGTVDFATYDGSGAPFSVQYPSDWDVQDQEADQNQVVFISPSQTASANVTYGPFDSSFNRSDAFDRILSPVFTDPNVISKTTNLDHSLTAELEHTSQLLGGRVHGYIRALTAGGNCYIAEFNVVTNEFAQYKDVGKAFVDSLTVSP